MSNIYMETATGIKAYPNAMTKDMISIADITTSLSRLPRYIGHTFLSYSVLEHSILVAETLRHRGCEPKTVLGGLMHDAKETYISDLPTPIKAAFDEKMVQLYGNEYAGLFSEVLQDVEYGIDTAICNAVGCITVDDMYNDYVKQADVDCLAYEARRIVHSAGKDWKFGREVKELPVDVIDMYGHIGHLSASVQIHRFKQLYDFLVKEITDANV